MRSLGGGPVMPPQPSGRGIDERGGELWLWLGNKLTPSPNTFLNK